jgi:hypothetical protein
MNSRPALLLLALLIAVPAARAAEAFTSCLPQVRVPLVVNIGQAARTPALLEGGIQTPLLLRDATSGRLLWSAAASDAIQRFAAMDAGFAASITALDLDGDGRHDRLYAGDLAGRLWRFDVQHGEPAESWLAGGVWADFSNLEGRGFIAAPDLSLSAPQSATPWLNIAIGTAAPGNPAARNRLYVLRDHAHAAVWSQAEYDRWDPLRESGLVRVDATPQAAEEAATLLPEAVPGWYFELGSGHVLVPSLTMNHRTTLVIAEGMPRGGSCEILPRIISLDLLTQRVTPGLADAFQDGVRSTIAADAQLDLSQGERMSQLVCTLAGRQVAGCTLDTTAQRTWWRREDAP